MGKNRNIYYWIIGLLILSSCQPCYICTTTTRVKDNKTNGQVTIHIDQEEICDKNLVKALDGKQDYFESMYSWDTTAASMVWIKIECKKNKR